MFEKKLTVVVEIPPGVLLQEVWKTEEQLKRVQGIETDLLEKKNIESIILLVLHIATTVIGNLSTVATEAKNIYDAAKVLYDFVHRSPEHGTGGEAKKKVVIIKKGKRIELCNLSIQEIESLLKEL